MENLIFLKSGSSEVATMNMFIKGETAFIPDFLLIFFYISVFLLDHVVDRIFIVYIILYSEEKIIIVLFVVSALIPLIILLIQLVYQEVSPNFNFCSHVLAFTLAVFGLDSIYLGAEALRGVTEFKKRMTLPKSNPFVHITEEKLFIFKAYCYMSILTKAIPQLIWMPILIMESNLSEFEHFLALTSIMANFLILSLTMTVTFPIRRSKTVYRTCVSLLVNSFSKFMATFCACCVHLIVFTVVYRYIRFKAFIVLLPKFLIWLYPSYHNLSHQGYCLLDLEVFFHGLCLALISAFIYIHPFQETGTFFYYPFNLLSFLTELVSINAFSETTEELIVVYLTLRVLVHGYVACFRVIDNLFTLRNEPVESVKTNVQDLEKRTSQGESLERKREANETENGDDNLELRQAFTYNRPGERDN